MLADVTISAREAAAERRRPGDSVDLRDHTDAIVWAATRAPSYRNTQPWLFRVAARQVEVYADRSRSCPVADPDDRELFLGLGAAVFGVRLAMSRLRVRPVVGLSRDHAHPDLAAVVVAAGHVHAPAEDDRLYDQLGRRRTIWTPFAEEPFPVELEVELADRIRHEGVARDGCSGHALGDWSPTSLGAPQSTSWRMPGSGSRPPDGRQRSRRRNLLRRSLRSAPPATTVPTGYAQGRRCITCCWPRSAAGMAGCFLSQLIEVPLLRRRLRSEFDLPGCPQVLLGLGRPQEPLPPPSPRRTVADVLTH